VTASVFNEAPLAGRHALACGSTGGIGQACARQFAALGATVTLLARNAEKLETTRASLATNHGQVHGVLCADFADWTAVRDTVNAWIPDGGPVHILLNNTGGPPGGPAHAADPEAFVDAFGRHLAAGQALVQAVLPGMRDAGYGRIINVISTSVVTPIKGLGVSNTIRGAVANWGRTLAHELGGDGITVNNVLPGFTATDRLGQLFGAKAERLGKTVEEIEAGAIATIPTGRLGAADEVAAVAAFLATPAASYVNGVNLPADGGRLAGQ
jgi:3-oxoacyl-[acyl-carrier protein] reductase